jgi:hypothetical protein
LEIRFDDLEAVNIASYIPVDITLVLGTRGMQTGIDDSFFAHSSSRKIRKIQVLYVRIVRIHTKKKRKRTDQNCRMGTASGNRH